MSEADRQRKYEKLGANHLAAGDRALKQATLVNSPKLKFYDAVACWHKAGKCFAIASEWEEAAVAFARAAEYMARTGFPHESAVYWLKSAQMHKRVDPVGSVRRFDAAAEAYLEMGRYFTAGNVISEVAEMYEDEKLYRPAMERYRQASEYYLGEHFVPQSCQCLYKVANIEAMLERYDDATTTFTQVAASYAGHKLLRLNLPSVLFRAGLCQLAQGGSLQGGLFSHQVLRFYMRRWSKLDYSWEYSRERQFLDQLMEVIAKGDLDGFADHCFNFDNVMGLEVWHLKLLKRVKLDIEAELARLEVLRLEHEAEKAQAALDRQAQFKEDYVKPKH